MNNKKIKLQTISEQNDFILDQCAAAEIQLVVNVCMIQNMF